MTEGTSRRSEDGYFKLYTHQKARLIQLEEENRHLRSALEHRSFRRIRIRLR
jgi:cell shape-determining protein MreC